MTDRAGDEVVTEERKVLVAQLHAGLGASWADWTSGGKAVDEIAAEIAERRKSSPVHASPYEVIEVVVVRRVRISGAVQIEEIP